MNFIKRPFGMMILILWIQSFPLFSQICMPLYHSPSSFLLTSPGTMYRGLNGYINPAMTATAHGSDTQFYISSPDVPLKNIDQWGFFTSSSFLGFGMIHQNFDAMKDGHKKSMDVTDYRLTLAGGSPLFKVGFGYGWSSGNTRFLSRDEIWMAGMLLRPNRYLSFGASVHYAKDKGDIQTIGDLALRPFGKDWLTLFGDVSNYQSDMDDESFWSMGCAVQPVSGIYLTGRYFDSEAVSLGLSLSFGTSGISSHVHTNDGEIARYTCGFRMGATDPNVIMDYLENDSKYLILDLKGRIKYQKFLLFDEDSQTLLDILQTINYAIEDPRVKGIALNLSESNMSSEMIWEIREALLIAKKAGIKIITHFENGWLSLYHLASVADQISMDPEGLCSLEGYAMGRTFYKKMREKVGIGFDEWRFFKYKSAYESYSREEMSEADREQRLALIENQYNLVKKDICESRNLSPAHLDSLVNNVFFFMANDALSHGLVDTLARWSDLDSIIKKCEGKEITQLSKKQLLHNVYPPQSWDPPAQIALVYATGICDMEQGINARKLEKILIGLSKKNNIKAIVLRVDSPGGSALASDLVAEALKKCKKEKPVIVSQGGVAASGGYWISMYADTIIAAPNTITGSIGVIGGWIWDDGFGEKLGMSTDHVQVGDHADLDMITRLPFIGLGIPARNLNEWERQRVEIFIKSAYQGFVQKVALGRNMSVDEVESIAQGHVWTGLAGKGNGLVDEIGGLSLAVHMARKMAGIQDSREISLVELPFKGWMNPAIFSPILFGMKLESPEETTWDYFQWLIENEGKPAPMLPPEYHDGF